MFNKASHFYLSRIPMKKTVVLLTLLTALLLTACDIPVKEKKALKLQKEIDRNMVVILSEMEKIQTTSLASYLDDHPTRRFFINGKSFNKNMMIQYLNSQYKALSGQKLRVIDPRAIVISHKSVLWSAEISVNQTGKDGQSGGEYRTDSWLWQKIDDRWKVTHFNLSSSGK